MLRQLLVCVHLAFCTCGRNNARLIQSISADGVLEENVTENVTGTNTTLTEAEMLLEGVAAFIANDVPPEELDLMRSVPVYASLESHGYSLTDAFGWFVIQEHVELSATLVELEEKHATMTSSFLQMDGAVEEGASFMQKDSDVEEDGESFGEIKPMLSLKKRRAVPKLESIKRTEYVDENPVDAVSAEFDDELQLAFDLYDENHDGVVSKKEVEHVLRALGKRVPEDFDKVYADIDKDDSKSWSKDEFNSYMKKAVVISDKDNLKAIFKNIDKDKSGKVSKRELLEMFTNLGIDMKGKEVETIIREFDKDKDGLEVDEFVNGLHSEKATPQMQTLLAKLKTAVFVVGSASKLSDIDDELEELETAQAGQTRQVQTIGLEALNSGLDPDDVNKDMMKKILKEYMNLPQEEPPLSQQYAKDRKWTTQEIATNTEGYRTWRRETNLIKTPKWWRGNGQQNAATDLGKLVLLHDRVFALYTKTQEHLELVRDTESITWEKLEKLSKWKVTQKFIEFKEATGKAAKSLKAKLGAAYVALKNAIAKLVGLFKSMKRFIQRAWLRFRSGATVLMGDCREKAENEEEKARLLVERSEEEKTSEAAGKPRQPRSEIAAEAVADNEIEQKLQAAERGLSDVAGTETDIRDKENKAGTQIQTAAKTGETLTKSMKADDAKKHGEAIKKAAGDICDVHVKKSAFSLKSVIQWITGLKGEDQEELLPDIGIRGIGGSLSVVGGGFEEVVDFRNMEIGYFAGAGIVIGGGAAAATVTGYTGVGWKGTMRKDWTLDESYRQSKYYMLRASVAVPLPIPVNATASIGVGMKWETLPEIKSEDEKTTVADDWKASEDWESGMKVFMVGASVGVALPGQGKQGVKHQAGVDRYRYITSECFNDPRGTPAANLREFQSNIWKVYCGTCKKAAERSQLTRGRSDALTMLGIGALRTSVHAVSFPIITDLLFQFLARKNSEKKHKNNKTVNLNEVDVSIDETGTAPTAAEFSSSGAPPFAGCSAYSVQNRINKQKIATLANYYAAQIKTTLPLFRFHLKRMEEWLELLHSQNAHKLDSNFRIGLYALSGARNRFRDMELISCRRYAFDGPLGNYFEDNSTTSKNLDCTSDDQCTSPENGVQNGPVRGIPNSECTRAKKGAPGKKTCQCRKGFCFKVKLTDLPLTDQSGRIILDEQQKPKRVYVDECVKPDGEDMQKSIKALRSWVRRAELEVGLFIHLLKNPEQLASLQLQEA